MQVYLLHLLWICGFDLSVFVFVELIGVFHLSVCIIEEKLWCERGPGKAVLLHGSPGLLGWNCGKLGAKREADLGWDLWDLHREDVLVRGSDSCGVGLCAMSISSVGGVASSYMMMRWALATARRHVRTCYLRFMSSCIRFHEYWTTVSLNQADTKKVYKIHLKWCP